MDFAAHVVCGPIMCLGLGRYWCVPNEKRSMNQTKIAIKKSGLKKVMDQVGGHGGDDPAALLAKMRQSGVAQADGEVRNDAGAMGEDAENYEGAVEVMEMSPEMHKQALRKAQQAEKRVRLGMQLLKASENRLASQSHVLNQVRHEQEHLRERVQEDVAKSLQSYDQWIGQIDDSFSKAMLVLEQKVDALSEAFEKKQSQLDQVIKRFEEQIEQNKFQAEEVQTQLRTCEVQVEDAVSFLLRRGDVETGPKLSGGSGTHVMPQRGVKGMPQPQPLPVPSACDDQEGNQFGDIPIRPLKLAQPESDREVDGGKVTQNADGESEPELTLKMDPAEALETLAENQMDVAEGKDEIYSKLLDELKHDEEEET